MSNFWNDPFGIKLIKCNSPAEAEEAAKEQEAPTQQPYYCYYYTTPNYYMAPPQQMQLPYFQINNMMPAMNYYQPPLQYPNMAPAIVPTPSPSPQAVHKCVACSARKKCSKCKKEEERQKKYVASPTFWNPRSKYNNDIFSR